MLLVVVSVGGIGGTLRSVLTVFTSCFGHPSVELSIKIILSDVHR